MSYDKYDAMADEAHERFESAVESVLARYPDLTREEAEEQASEELRESEPCCNDFSCPCGNTNTFRGF